MGTRRGPDAFVVLCALAPEALAARIGLARFARRSSALRPRGRVQVTGMGPVRSRTAVARLDSVLPWDLPVVVVGVAGALVRGFEAGDLVVASALGVADTVAGSGLEVTEPPKVLDTRSSELGERLLSALSNRYASTTSAPLLSAVRIARGSEREQLARCGAVVCDTESAWLAELAEGRPFAVVRSIVDTPERELVSPGTLRAGSRALRRLVGVVDVIAEALSG